MNSSYYQLLMTMQTAFNSTCGWFEMHLLRFLAYSRFTTLVRNRIKARTTSSILGNFGNRGKYNLADAVLGHLTIQYVVTDGVINVDSARDEKV